jgi:hypothetical protein
VHPGGHRERLHHPGLDPTSSRELGSDEAGIEDLSGQVDEEPGVAALAPGQAGVEGGELPIG